jgi:hypothetical protein
MPVNLPFCSRSPVGPPCFRVERILQKPLDIRCGREAKVKHCRLQLLYKDAYNLGAVEVVGNSALVHLALKL